MSNKFEKLLDYLVNEEIEKANELFHEIIVEKSREIYSDLIAEEVEEDLEEETDDEDNQEESDDDQQDEGFMHDEDESMYEIGGDSADDLTHDVEDPDAMGHDDEMHADMDDEFGGEEAEEDHATKSDIMDIKDDIAELKAEFEALLAHEKEEDEEDDLDFDTDTEFGDEDDDESDDSEDDQESDEEEVDSDDDDEEADESFMREYREVVGKPYGGGKVAGTKEDASTNTRPVVSSAKGRPESKANASNLNQSGGKEGQKVGLAGTTKGEFTKSVDVNVDGKETGVKKLSKVSVGHGAEKKGHGETSVNDKPILKTIK